MCPVPALSAFLAPHTSHLTPSIYKRQTSKSNLEPHSLLLFSSFQDVATTAVDTLARNLAVLGVDMDSDHRLSWAQSISLGMVAVVTFTTTRAFVVAVFRSRWSAPRSALLRFAAAIPTNVLAILTTLLMGLYLLSSLLLVRVNVPCRYRAFVSAGLGDVAFGFFHQWFDTIFVVSAVATGALTALHHWPDPTTSSDPLTDMNGAHGNGHSSAGSPGPGVNASMTHASLTATATATSATVMPPTVVAATATATPPPPMTTTLGTGPGTEAGNGTSLGYHTNRRHSQP